MSCQQRIWRRMASTNEALIIFDSAPFCLTLTCVQCTYCRRFKLLRRRRKMRFSRRCRSLRLCARRASSSHGGRLSTRCEAGRVVAASNCDVGGALAIMWSMKRLRWAQRSLKSPMLASALATARCRRAACKDVSGIALSGTTAHTAVRARSLARWSSIRSFGLRGEERNACRRRALSQSQHVSDRTPTRSQTATARTWVLHQRQDTTTPSRSAKRNGESTSELVGLQRLHA